MSNDIDLRTVVEYDELTGVFIWLNRPPNQFKTEGAFKTWNKKHALNEINNPDQAGYLYLNIGGERHPLHRLAWYISTGEKVDLIDHINGNKSDNRITNLRPATLTENNRHQGLKKSNTSGFKGVCFSKQKGKWLAQIRTDEGRESIGFFSSKIDAARAYDKAAINYHGAFAKTNKTMGLL